MELGHLFPKGSKIQDAKKFPQLCSNVMDKIEARHGTKLKPMVSVLCYACGPCDITIHLHYEV